MRRSNPYEEQFNRRSILGRNVTEQSDVRKPRRGAEEFQGRAS